MTSLIVEVTNLSKSYRSRGGSKVAVHDFSMSLRHAGSVAIVGESGSGKTTVARCLAGLEQASSGSITVCGRSRDAPPRGLVERRQRATELQMVFQDPYASLNPAESVATSLRRALAAHAGTSTRAVDDGQLNELLELVELPGRVGELHPRQLSGGQRQRVAIARALAARPRVLVLDEAVAALDVSVQAHVLNVLAEVRRVSEISFVFISHDLSVVRQICDDIIVMREGKVVEQGAVSEVLDSPAEDYTRELLDAVPRPGWTPAPPRSVLTASRTNAV